MEVPDVWFNHNWKRIFFVGFHGLKNLWKALVTTFPPVSPERFFVIILLHFCLTPMV
jgi:hypothetical protein